MLLFDVEGGELKALKDANGSAVVVDTGPWALLLFWVTDDSNAGPGTSIGPG